MANKTKCVVQIVWAEFCFLFTDFVSSHAHHHGDTLTLLDIFFYRLLFVLFS